VAVIINVIHGSKVDVEQIASGNQTKLIKRFIQWKLEAFWNFNLNSVKAVEWQMKEQNSFYYSPPHLSLPTLTLSSQEI